MTHLGPIQVKQELQGPELLGR